MADLWNVLESKKNTNILVNGTVYAIGPDGVIKGLTDEDAAKLLKNDRVYKEVDPKRAGAQRKQAAEEAKAKTKMQLLDAAGKPIKFLPDTPGAPMDPLMDSYQREGPPPVPTEEVEETLEEEVLEEEVLETKNDPTESVPEEEILEEATEEAKEETVEGEEDEWPDPEMEMGIDYLRQMATAYEVTHTKRTPKKALVKKIKEAMYS